jgi:FKBP-type peptidyl-prolyl cis-trans isomerase
MYRTLIFSAFSALALAACAPTAAPAPTQDGDTATLATDDIMPAAFEKHLPWDAKGTDVKDLGDGLQYIVLKKGADGGQKPAPTDMVSVHYEGRLSTGEKFDSSFDRGSPASFRLNQVIRGWTLGLQEMSPGDEYLFYIPAALGYGDRPRPGGVIKPGDDLVFLVQLLDIEVPKTADAAAWGKYLPWKPDLPEVKKTESGLEYVVLASGDPSGISPANGQYVRVHYEGRLASNGELFDSSYERGEPEEFPSNRLIPGWVEALEMMKPGDRWMLFVPSKLAYGATGTPGGPIPPNTDLQFEVELLDVAR